MNICLVFAVLTIFLNTIASSSENEEPIFIRSSKGLIVPDIVHQIYDYSYPSLFLFLSIASVKVFQRPKRFILWVNDEGRFRKAHFHGWLDKYSQPDGNIMSNVDNQLLSYAIAHAGDLYQSFQANKDIDGVVNSICKLAIKTKFNIHFSSDCDTMSVSAIHSALRKMNLSMVSDTLSQESIWLSVLSQWIKTNSIEANLITFPINPPGNSSIHALNKAHRSDFVRMEALQRMGGIYLDTDVFLIENLNEFRRFPFTMAFDNIVNLDKSKPNRLNNGIILSIPNATYLNHWISEYRHFDASSWDLQSSIVPFRLSMEYPDLIHMEMSRLSPVSFGFHTAQAAVALTCGIFNDVNKTIHYPKFDRDMKSFSFQDTSPSRELYDALSRKMALHLTMTQARGYCMMRKNLASLSQVASMPSLLGHYLRTIALGFDSYDYQGTSARTDDEKLSLWNQCRSDMGIHYVADLDENYHRERQQYMPEGR